MAHNYTIGQPFTLALHRAVDDDPPAMMTERNRRRVGASLKRHETAVRSRQLDGVRQAVEQLNGQQESIRAALDQDEADIAAIQDGVRTGEFDPAAAEQAIAEIVRGIKAHRASLDRIEASITRVQEVADQDPADWEQTTIGRFPILRDRLPRLTEQWLFGADDRDPFIGGAS